MLTSRQRWLFDVVGGSLTQMSFETNAYHALPASTVIFSDIMTLLRLCKDTDTI